MFSRFMLGDARRRAGTFALCGVALLVAACSNSVTATPTPNPLVRGQWLAPVFANLTAPVGALAFADGNQQVGYACTAIVNPAANATPTVTATPGDATPATTPTLNIPGKPTPPPTTNDLQNAFWRTSNGGQTWQTATLPANPANLLCPVSAIVASDLANPNDVFFLAASGSLNLEQPTSILPGQLQYQLWRSQDGAQTWQQLAVPIAPNPLTPVSIEPYHLVIVAKGQDIALASNQSGATALFASGDGGKSWSQRLAPVTASGAPAGTYAFAGFAAGADATLDALVVNTAADTGTAPYALWQSDDAGQSWRTLSTITFTPPTGASMATQLFSAPGGHVLYALLHAAGASGGTAAATSMLRSADAGVTWKALGWPTSQANATTPPGAGDLASLGANVAIDAAGTAYIAPPVSDAPLTQDATAQNSAGFFAATVADNGWKLVASPKTSGALAIGLAVSSVPNSFGTGGTSTPAAAPTVTAATSAIGTPAGSANTPTTGLPTLWTNFGPLTQLSAQPGNVGLFFNVLP